MYHTGDLVGKTVFEDPTRKGNEPLRYILKDSSHRTDANATVIDNTIAIGIHNAQGTKFKGVRVFMEVMVDGRSETYELPLSIIAGWTIHLDRIVFDSYIITSPPASSRSSTHSRNS